MSIKFKSVVFVPAVLMLLISTASATCVRDINGAVVTDNDGVGSPPAILKDSTYGMGDACPAIPDAYTVNFYKLGICTEDPSANDLSSCQFMLNSNAVNGVQHTISYPAESALATGEFEIAPGSYGYMVGVLSNKLGITHTETFSEQLVGSSGSGTSCWTNGITTAMSGDGYTHEAHGVVAISDPISPALDCGSADSANPVVSYEVIDTMGENCGAGFSIVDTGFTMSNGTASGRLLQNNGITDATSCANASRILWVVDLTTALVVTPTTQFTLSFKLTDAVSVDAGSNGGVGTMVKMGADPFQAILTTR